MPQEKPRAAGTARRGSAWEALYEQTNAIRQQLFDDSYSPPIRRPAPPTRGSGRTRQDMFNRGSREGVRSPAFQTGEREPWLGGARSRADTASAYGAHYHIAPEMADLIVAAARKNDLDLPTAFGLVDVESGFRQTKESGVGAVGLAQVRPEYAGKEQGYTEKQLREYPASNLDAGFGFYKRMEAATETPEDALDAYNRGLSAHKREKRTGYARKVMGER